MEEVIKMLERRKQFLEGCLERTKDDDTWLRQHYTTRLAELRVVTEAIEKIANKIYV